MTEEQYARLTEPLRRHPQATRCLIILNKALTLAGYVLYPLLLVLLAVFEPRLLARCIVVPAVGFVLLTLLRRAVNAPRPYEKLAIEPLIKKDTRGKSFPSRHTLCMFMIAVTWLVWQPVVGAVLLAASVLMATARVLGGVHFPRDVIAGAAFALVMGAIGYIAIPLPL